MAVSVLRAILDIELDLDRNVGQVLGCAVWFDYRHIPIPGSKSKPNETKDCKFVRFWIVRDDSFRKPRKSVED